MGRAGVGPAGPRPGRPDVVSYTLGIATATSQVGIAFGGPDGPVASLHVSQRRRHAEMLAPGIQELSRLAGVGLNEIDQIAVDIGPGLFTGLRVGVATAKALGSALGVLVVGCSSLELLAEVHRHSDRTVAAIVDARRGEVFWALYRATAGAMVALTEPVSSRPAAVVGALTAAANGAAGGRRVPILATGDGARRYAEELSGVPGLEIDRPGNDHPSAAVLVELASRRAGVQAERIVPVYLRAADVRIGWEQRGG